VAVSPALALSLVLMAAVLISASAPWSEVAVAVPAAAVLVGLGALSTDAAMAEIRRLAPVVAFLALVLVLSRLCDDEGLFRVAGRWMARSSDGRPDRLLGRVFVVAAATTAVLSLDATVVLLTPVVLETARALRVSARPHSYATVHLSNTASLLLPVSNLTNLLAFTAAGISFSRFAALMAGPWAIAIALEYLVIRRVFRRDLTAGVTVAPAPAPDAAPVFVLVVLASTLAGFAVTSLWGLSPIWSALAGVMILGVHAMARGRSTVGGVLRAANLPFLAFVLALGVVVAAAMANGMDAVVGGLLPSGTSLPSLLGIAAVAALLSNLANNLPAVLVLIPLLAGAGPGAVLAALIGVNIGPNLTVVGSLANLLWRRVLHQRGEPTSVGGFSLLGLCTVPVCLVAAVVALWAGLRVFGG